MRPPCNTRLLSAVLTLGLPAGAFAGPPPLAAPANVTVTAAYRQMTLAWSGCPGARSYDIYRSTAAGREGTAPLAIGVTGPPYVDTGLTNGMRYFYTVRAVGNAGPSDASAEASDTPRPSADEGRYLVTYWAGNSAPLAPDDNGNYSAIKNGSHGHVGTPVQPVKITATFTFQPGSANDTPPSCIILTASTHRGDGQPSRVHYSVKNDPGLSFTVTDTTDVPEGPVSTLSRVPVSPKPAVPALPPYQTNPDLFASRAEAVRALQSPDILLRRSGVEWLGTWTQTVGSSGPPGRDARREEFRRMTALVPALTRGVREMPDRDSQQAARLLALIGPPARSAIPAVCAALASPAYGNGRPGEGDDFVARADLLGSLTRLCGGPYALAPTLTALLHDRDPETRRAAAAALRFCDDPTFLHTSPPLGAYPYMSPEEDRQWHKAFLALVLPELALRLDNDTAEVRLAAAQSLERWTYSPDAPWMQTLAPLARAAASPNPALRLAALRTLAFMPGDLAPSAPALRAALHTDEADRPWALAALSHAAWTGRAHTVDAFLLDLAAPDVPTRRMAASDLRLASTVLWDGAFPSGSYPLPGWWNDSRLSRVSSPPDPTAAASQTRLLAALVRAVSDPDTAVRSDAAASLEQIGQETDRRQGFGGIRKGDTGQSTAAVTAALAQAASFLQETDSASAKRLADLRTHILALRAIF